MNLDHLSEATILAQQILDSEPRGTVMSLDPGGDSDFAGIVLLTYDERAPRHSRRYLCQRLVRVPLHTGYEDLEALVV